MRMGWRRAMVLLAAMLLLWGAVPVMDVRAEEAPAIPYPPLTEDGYLPADSAEEEFVHVDVKAGRWAYVSRNLHIEIERFKGKVEGRATVWFVSDIKAKDGMLLQSFQESPDKPGKKKTRPEYIAQKQRVVYAQNGDLWTWRMEDKRYPGIIIRDGQIVQEKTYKKMVEAQPPLDEMSLYRDGHIEVHHPGEYTGEQYLEKGAYDVFSFGPILIRDGVVDARLEKNFTSAQPRSAIGMIEPGHYVGVMVEGRTKRSFGTSLKFVASVLAERGCTLAFNLDGGQTSAMVFMGTLVMHEPTYNGYTNTRNQPDIIGIGTSEDVKVFRK